MVPVILIRFCLVRRAPVSQDVPADAVVAEPRDEVQRGPYPRRPGSAVDPKILNR